MLPHPTPAATHRDAPHQATLAAIGALYDHACPDGHPCDEANP